MHCRHDSTPQPDTANGCMRRGRPMRDLAPPSRALLHKFRQLASGVGLSSQHQVLTNLPGGLDPSMHYVERCNQIVPEPLRRLADRG